MSQRLADLVERHLDGALDAEGQRELSGLLSNPAQQKEAVSQARLALRLGAWLHSIDVADVAKRARAIVDNDQPAQRQQSLVAVKRRIAIRHQRAVFKRVARRALSVLATLIVIFIGYSFLPTASVRTLDLAPIATATLSDIHGQVVIVRSGVPISAQANMTILSGDQISTAPEHIVPSSSARLRWLAEATTVAIGADSVMTVRALSPDKNLLLARGSIRSTAAHQIVGHPLTVRTPHATVTVVGTCFEVDADINGSRVDVRSGSVQVANNSGDAIMVPENATLRIVPGLPLAITAMPSPADLASGLLGHWRFDEGIGEIAADDSGHGHTGRIAHGTWVAGRIGRAIHCDGDTLVTITGSESLTPTQFTVALWMQLYSPLDHTRLTYPALVTRQTWPEHTGFWFGEWFGDLGLRLMAGPTATPSTREEISSGSTCRWISYKEHAIAAWVHVVGTWDGTMMRMYRNGLEQRALSAPAFPFIYPGPREPMIIGYHVEGDLDDVRFYDRALASEEIRALSRLPDP